METEQVKAAPPQAVRELGLLFLYAMARLPEAVHSTQYPSFPGRYHGELKTHRHTHRGWVILKTPRVLQQEVEAGSASLSPRPTSQDCHLPALRPSPASPSLNKYIPA